MAKTVVFASFGPSTDTLAKTFQHFKMFSTEEFQSDSPFLDTCDHMGE